MKRRLIALLLFLLVLGATVFLAKVTAELAAELLLPHHEAAMSTQEPTVPTEKETLPPTEAPEPTEPEITTVPAELPDVYSFTEEEKTLLLKLGMSERGETGCPECVALVMRTALNRVESGRFSSTLRGVIYAKDQFTPVAEGTFEDAVPNEICREALKMITKGYDESQGALYYEWCEGESWHSQNLQLLFSHCDTRFYR